MPRTNVYCDQCKKDIEKDTLAYFSDAENDLDFCSEDCYSKWNSEGNWENIHLDFTLELKKQWKNKGFDYDECKEWINIGLATNEAKLANYLRSEGYAPEWCLNEGKLDELKQKYEKWKRQPKIFRIINDNFAFPKGVTGGVKFSICIICTSALILIPFSIHGFIIGREDAGKLLLTFVLSEFALFGTWLCINEKKREIKEKYWKQKIQKAKNVDEELIEELFRAIDENGKLKKPDFLDPYGSRERKILKISFFSNLSTTNKNKQKFSPKTH